MDKERGQFHNRLRRECCQDNCSCGELTISPQRTHSPAGLISITTMMDPCACATSTPETSYGLVQPSYVVLKIASVCSFLDYDVTVATGNIRSRSSNCLTAFHFLNYALLFLKASQFSYSTLRLSGSNDTGKFIS